MANAESVLEPFSLWVQIVFKLNIYSILLFKCIIIYELQGNNIPVIDCSNTALLGECVGGVADNWVNKERADQWLAPERGGYSIGGWTV